MNFPGKSTFVLASTVAEEAAVNGDVEKLKDVLTSNILDIATISQLLYTCCKLGYHDCVVYLLQKGGKSNYWQSQDDETCLSIACTKGYESIASTLLEIGCDVNTRCYGDMHSALHTTAITGSVPCLKVLLKYNATINVKDCFAHTALMRACKFGYHEIVHLLLCNGADPCIKNIRKENAFTISLQSNQTECVKELVQFHPEFNRQRTVEGLLPLTHAIKSKNTRMIQAFAEAGCDMNAVEGVLLTPLQIALETDDIPTIIALLKGGCNVNTPLGLPSGSTPLMLAVCKGRTDFVEVLLQSNCNLDHLDVLGRSALYLAVKFGYLNSVHKLLAAGADPDAYGRYQMNIDICPSPTALHCAILYNKPEEAVALIQSGCDLNFPAVYEDQLRQDDVFVSCTPLDVACGRDASWAVNLLTAANPFVLCHFHGYKGSTDTIIQMLEQAKYAILKPPTLKQICQNHVRMHLGGKGLIKTILLLPLPTSIIDYLLYRDLEGLI